MKIPIDRRRIVVAITGSNGAGKTTFHDTQLSDAGLRFVNADTISAALAIDSYKASQIADAIRRELFAQRESFVFETVFSDPVGDKLAFLKELSASGYQTILCFIGISSPKVSEQRVVMRISRGGHPVPAEKLIECFPRTLANLQAAMRELAEVRVFDNDDLREPFRLVAVSKLGIVTYRSRPMPKWLKPLLP